MDVCAQQLVPFLVQVLGSCLNLAIKREIVGLGRNKAYSISYYQFHIYWAPIRTYRFVTGPTYENTVLFLCTSGWSRNKFTYTDFDRGYPVVLIIKLQVYIYIYIYINFSQSTTIFLVYIMFIIYNIRATSFGFMLSSGPLQCF